MSSWRGQAQERARYRGRRATFRTFLAAISLLALPVRGGTSQIELTEIVSGLSRPLFLTHAGDQSGRLFLLEQGGRIRILEDGSLLSTPFLDISSGFNLTSNGERGLLGLAFHPDFAVNGRFFINYTRDNGQIETIIQEHSVSGDPNVASPNGQILLIFNQPAGNHNGGWIGFGPADGYLYIATGDGGGQHDPNQQGQDLGTLLGKILRIDIDSASPYGVPGDNPFVDVPGARGEIWAYGFRNPWRASFDPPTGRLFVGDVGQSTFEEVDLVESGENYGWDIMEAESCHEPSSGCNTSGLELPIDFYGRGLGQAVTGGYVYRGQQIPQLQGRYIFADYGSGRIWALNEAAGWSRSELFDTNLNISSLGEDAQGELYLVHHGGQVFRLTGTQPPPDLAVTKSSQQTDVLPGEEFVFNINVENQGEGEATSVTLIDSLPAGLGFVSATPSQGSCSTQGSTVSCELGGLATGFDAQVSLTVVSDGMGEISNTASATAVPADGNSANNSDSATVNVGAVADLAVEKSLASPQIELGSTFAFNLSVTNLGPSTATSVTLNDTLPPGLSPVSAPEPCSFLSGPTFHCSFDSIAPQVTHSVDFFVRADLTGQFTNTARVEAAETDPQSPNDADTVAFSVVASPDLEIRKIDLGPLIVGTRGTYRLTVENVGNADANGPITLNDQLPPSLATLSLQADGWSCQSEPAAFSCQLPGGLAVGESRELAVSVVAGPGAVPQVVNTATVSHPQDSNPSNNTASITTSVFEVGVLPRRFAQFALGDVFEVVLLVANKGQGPWQGQGLLHPSRGQEWDSPWTLDGVDKTGTGEFEIALAPRGSRKYRLAGDSEVREGFFDLMGTNSPNDQLAVSFFYQVTGSGLMDSIATFDTPPSKVLVFPVENSTRVDTGFAYAALDAAEPFAMKATLIDPAGTEVDTVTWSYEGHEALFFTELFDLFEDFVGSLRIESEVSLFLTVVRVEESIGGFQLTNVPPESGY